MSFGSKSSKPRAPKVSGPPSTPTQADRSVIMAGLMNLGLRENKLPQFSTDFATGGGGTAGRKPGLTKRALIGGA